jgi:hypothetical protein
VKGVYSIELVNEIEINHRKLVALTLQLCWDFTRFKTRPRNSGQASMNKMDGYKKKSSFCNDSVQQGGEGAELILGQEFGSNINVQNLGYTIVKMGGYKKNHPFVARVSNKGGRGRGLDSVKCPVWTKLQRLVWGNRIDEIVLNMDFNLCSILYKIC